MDHETYFKRVRALHEELARIWQEIRQEVLAGTANAGNQRFRALWDRQTAIHEELAVMDAAVIV